MQMIYEQVWDGCRWSMGQLRDVYDLWNSYGVQMIYEQVQDVDISPPFDRLYCYNESVKIEMRRGRLLTAMLNWEMPPPCVFSFQQDYKPADTDTELQMAVLRTTTEKQITKMVCSSTLVFNQVYDFEEQRVIWNFTSMQGYKKVENHCSAWSTV